MTCTPMMRIAGMIVAAAGLCCWAPCESVADDIRLHLQYQAESSAGSGRFHHTWRDETWDPKQTAIIVCDVWDLHHCLNAVRRMKQFLPRLDQVLHEARSRGVTIIHSPSDCMDAYADHPARARALETPAVNPQPEDIGSWCSVIPPEQRGVYPIDQSDGGEDDDPFEHAQWKAQLEARGRSPAMPWKSQSDLITIDAEKDFISDRGDEVWNILASRGIKNVILTGVHTNMCVLGRPFGLRQMARNGKNVVLMRDMTDTMYNPQQWPYVSHFTGTDLIVDHIERYVCPTVTSDQFVGGRPFRLSGDRRPHLVIVMAEDEYRTAETLPLFAADHLGREFRVTLVYGSDTQRNHIPGLAVLEDADLLLLSVRRRVLPPDDMKRIREFVARGKPVLGIRTASHAFSLRGKPAPDGLVDWPQLDAEVFGGNYHGHHGNKVESQVQVAPAAASHPILNGVTRQAFPQGWSLYQTSPLAAGATVLLQGRAEGKPDEPVAWTFVRRDGGRSFYTSLGHVDDFANPEFVRLLLGAIRWAADLDIPVDGAPAANRMADANQWNRVLVPSPHENRAKSTADNGRGAGWYRCVVRLPGSWLEGQKTLSLTIPGQDVHHIQAWLNGNQLEFQHDSTWAIPASGVTPDDANLLVLRIERSRGHGGLPHAPVVSAGTQQSLELRGRWQFRMGEQPSWSNMPLPSKFGGSPDVVHAPPEPLFTARPVTRPGEFTPGIEGPACDAWGNVYAVNYGSQGTIGRVTPEGSGEVFVQLPPDSVGNGIRFDQDGFFYVADYTRHNVLRVDPKSRHVTTLAHNPMMNQPNDLAMAPDGTLYASDPNWSKGTGQLWRIDRDGTTARLAKDMGTTNGIDVSPDGRTLYVNESVQRNVWAFAITPQRMLTDKRLIRQFDDHGFDGMRCDVDGNLYITRHGKGTVIKMSPSGDILREVDVLGTRPSNLCFGGPDGCTVYVTEVDMTRLVQFRVDRPGAAWERLNGGGR